LAPVHSDPITTSYAFWGTGKAEIENIGPLLDSELPRPPHHIGGVFRPDRVPRHMTGLSATVGWLEEELRDPETQESGLSASTDLIADLLARREAGDEVKLIVVWPEEPTTEEIEFVLNAHEQGIRVMSLGDALNDLDFTPYEPTPQEEAAEEEAAATEDVAAAVVEKILGDNDSADALLLALRRYITDVATEVYLSLQGSAADAKPLEHYAVSAPPRAAANGETQDDPPFDGGMPESELPRHKYWTDNNGEYRVKKGRPRNVKKKDDATKVDPETEVLLSDAEVADITARGLIKS
jgi:hypothetical protein